MKENDKKEILNAIGILNKKIDVMQEQVAKIPEMQEDITNIKTDVINIQNNIRNINRSVAVIEHEHGDKIKAMFDTLIVNNEKIYQEQERISFCERKIENHDNEIYYLKAKVQGL